MNKMSENSFLSAKYPPVLPSPLVRRLGYAGLLPFVLLAALLWAAPVHLHAFLAMALVAYGAVIASFLGGVHWGIAAQLPPGDAAFHYVWGVVPSLVAWAAILLPAYAGLPLLGLILVACYLVDKQSYPRVGWAAWLPMRLQLTVVAVLSCVLGAARAG
jgi:Protein of unknown function (DUF3429)